MSNLHMTDIR